MHGMVGCPCRPRPAAVNSERLELFWRGRVVRNSGPGRGEVRNAESQGAKQRLVQWPSPRSTCSAAAELPRPAVSSSARTAAVSTMLGFNSGTSNARQYRTGGGQITNRLSVSTCRIAVVVPILYGDVRPLEHRTALYTRAVRCYFDSKVPLLAVFGNAKVAVEASSKECDAFLDRQSQTNSDWAVPLMRQHTIANAWNDARIAPG
jgi:hypothetical protein